MIKFIATDLDGTLLTNDKRLPAEIFGLIRAMSERGILFAPASGRQYANLKKLFAPVADKVVFLAEIRAIPHLYPMLCGETCAYLEDDVRPFFDYAMDAYTNCVKVDRLEEIIGRERICKIAVYDEIAAAENCIQKLPSRLPALRTAISGFDWCDVSSPDSNKGAAIRVIRSRFGLKREECVAFGDHMNDFEMLVECGTAYVPANAYPPLKEQFPVIAANEAGGVLVKIKEILSQSEIGRSL